jgi:hypothetical protein
MSIARIWIAAVTFSVFGWIVPIAVANADCTTAGDFGAAAGCAPSSDDSSGSGKAESWPPTSVDWPPQLKSDTDSDSKGGEAKSTPIVMPKGQKAPPTASPSNSTSTSTTPTPIVIPQH